MHTKKSIYSSVALALLLSTAAAASAIGGSARTLKLGYGDIQISVPVDVSVKKITKFEFEKYEFERRGAAILTVTLSQRAAFFSSKEMRESHRLLLNGLVTWRVCKEGDVRIMIQMPRGSLDSYALVSYRRDLSRADALLAVKLIESISSSRIEHRGVRAVLRFASPTQVQLLGRIDATQ